MEQYICDFITYLKDIKHASSNTIQAYLNDLKKMEQFFSMQSINTASNISGTILNSYVLYLEKKGLSPASVSRCIASMKSFILYLIKQGIIKGDPSEQIRAPKISKKAPPTLSRSEIELLLKQPDLSTNKGIRDRAMLELLYATGMKVSEIISITVKDVNINGRYLICHDKKERILPFGTMAKETIQAYLKIREEGFNRKKGDYLFMNTTGNQLSRQGFWKILKGYADEAGLNDVNPNTIRHSFAAHMLDNGADIVSVQELLGHSDNGVTKIYMPHNYRNNKEVYSNSHPRA